MTDADHDAVRQLGSQRAVQRELLTFVQRRGRLVEEYHLRFGEQHAGERDALLFAGREDLRPVGHLVEPAAQVAERHGVERRLDCPSENLSASAGYEITARRSPSGTYGSWDRNMVLVGRGAAACPT